MSRRLALENSMPHSELVHLEFYSQPGSHCSNKRAYLRCPGASLKNCAGVGCMSGCVQAQTRPLTCIWVHPPCFALNAPSASPPRSMHLISRYATQPTCLSTDPQSATYRPIRIRVRRAGGGKRNACETSMGATRGCPLTGCVL